MKTEYAMWHMDLRREFVYYFDAAKQLVGWRFAVDVMREHEPRKLAPWHIYHEPGAFEFWGWVAASGEGASEEPPQ